MLKVRNFEKFQHYKDRSPIWIKLYRSLLRDYEFGQLPDAARAHLILIWLLASETGNELPNDAAWIGRQINASDPVDLDLLIRTGFLIDCASKSASNGAPDPASKSASAVSATVLAQSRAEAEQRESREREEAAAEVAQRAEQSRGSNAAAAGDFNENHSSAFAFAEVEAFVRATKPHIRNPGGMARKLWRSGEEDAAIEEWRKPKEETEAERRRRLLAEAYKQWEAEAVAQEEQFNQEAAARPA